MHCLQVFGLGVVVKHSRLHTDIVDKWLLQERDTEVHALVVNFVLDTILKLVKENSSLARINCRSTERERARREGGRARERERERERRGRRREGKGREGKEKKVRMKQGEVGRQRFCGDEPAGSVQSADARMHIHRWRDCPNHVCFKYNCIIYNCS